MADTLSMLVDPSTVFGNYRVTMSRFTLSGPTAVSVLFGLDTVKFCVMSPASITSYYHHQLTGNGGVNLYSCTAADVFNVVAIGK